MDLCTRLNQALVVLVLLLGVQSVTWPGETVDLRVDGAVRLSLQNNLNLRLQRQEVRAAKGSELAERGGFDAVLQAGAATARQRMTGLILGASEEETNTEWNAGLLKKLPTGTELELFWENQRYETDSNWALVNPSYNAALSLGISQPLLKDRGREVQTASIRAAAKEVEAVSYLVDSRAADLAASVKSAYWDLVFAGRDIEVRRISLDLAEKLREETRQKIEAGIMAAVEIHEPDAEVALREERLIDAERAVADAEDALKLLLNMKEWDRSVNPLDRPVIHDRLPVYDEVLTNAFARRGDLKAADLSVEAARIVSDKAGNQILPSLALTGSVGIGGSGESYGESLTEIAEDTESRWQLGIVFSTPLEKNTARGNYHQARAELAKARTRAEILRQELRRTAREAVRNVRLTRKGVEAASKTSLAAEKRLETEENKFKVGLATANDVLEAQEAYAQALSNEELAKINFAKAQAEIDRIQGRVTLAGN